MLGHKNCHPTITTRKADIDDGPFFELNLTAPQQSTQPSSLSKSAKFRLFLIFKFKKAKPIPKPKPNQTEPDKETLKQSRNTSKPTAKRTLLELLSLEEPFVRDIDKKTKRWTSRKQRKFPEKRTPPVGHREEWDEVKLQQDGIQSAILYCKRSFSGSQLGI